LVWVRRFEEVLGLQFRVSILSPFSFAIHKAFSCTSKQIKLELLIICSINLLICRLLLGTAYESS
jgi:hypothetical protein